jgi:transposase
MVDIEDVQYRLVHVLRQKYVCACGGVVETAPGPERAIDGGRYSLGFAAKVADEKYDRHMPLARQERVMRQSGLDIRRTTLWDQLVALTPSLRAAHAALRSHILAQAVIGVDQTGWPCLHGQRPKPWQMWCLTAPDAVYHAIRDDKSAATFRDVLEGFRGIAVCDALSSHGSAVRALEGVRLAHCFAHVVRRFKQAASDFEQAQVPLALLRKLYDIDATAETAERRRELRSTESRTVMNQLKAWLTSTASNKASSLGQAIRYTLGIWAGLNVFLEDERVWLDNNRTERGLRGPVVGRKNHYGSKSRLGTEVASVFYSLIETAKLHGVPARAYLVEAVRAGRRGEIILPWQMAG